MNVPEFQEVAENILVKGSEPQFSILLKQGTIWAMNKTFNRSLQLDRRECTFWLKNS